ncbi:WD domain-containing protein, related [Eimeria maxima]|uniref:WD domain-containing protein, related n=1 Tax=Eimeria maxima TaxID=5804 RepID=U6MBZ3_EIMMA|nr:WD domain-containing protein, related [Eimeria maxima]CDJ59185.1 WD domain-containing protein, related [Eimeria maxima]
MCRLTAIITRGDPILLADVLTRPRRSIIQQSFNCQERLRQDDIRNAYQKASLNGDGFGVGWYVTKSSKNASPSVSACTNLSLFGPCGATGDGTNGKKTPDAHAATANPISSVDDGGACVFTSLKPAWADRNLYNLAEKISSRLFFAHVRAASSTLGVSHCAGCDGGLPSWAVENGSVSTELCCHPFRCGRFLFMHNGNVGGFNRIRRDLLSLLPDPMFSFAITNSCIDSACLFAVFLALLPNSPTEPSTHSAMKDAVEQMIATICWLLDREKIEETTLINIVVSDGESIVATRFVTNAQEVAYVSGKSSIVPDPTGETSPTMPPSLYFATGTAWQQQEDACDEYRMTHKDKRTDICIVTSEPLTSNPEDWMPVPRNTMILITPAIDLLLYPIASVGYLPSLLRSRRRSGSVVPPQEIESPSSDRQIALRKCLAPSLADKLEEEIAALLKITSSSSVGTLRAADELPVIMLRSLEGVIRELARATESTDGEEAEKPWRALELKLQGLEKQLRAAQVQRQAVAAIEDGQSQSPPGSSMCSTGLPQTNLYHAELNSETPGTNQQCYELLAGSCAILCLETILIHVTSYREDSKSKSFSRTPSSALPVAAKTFVFVGMQSGEVVIYDATSASVAPISFQAHVGGVLAMAVHANIFRRGCVSTGRAIACKNCGSALPEVFLVTGGSDTSLAVWDLSPLIFGGREPRLLSGKRVCLDGPRVSIDADDLLAVRLTFLPHQGDVLSLLVRDSPDCAHTNGSHHDPSTRTCIVDTCEACLQAIHAAMRLDDSGGASNVESAASPLTSLPFADLHKIQPNPFVDEPECNLLLFIGFQSAKIGAVFLNDLLRYFRHTQVMVSVLANAVSFQPTQQQSLPLSVSRDFELRTLASGQLKVQFTGEQEGESLRSLFTGDPQCVAERSQSTHSPTQDESLLAMASPRHTSGLAKGESFRCLLAGFARALRSVTLHASHAATTLWSKKCSLSGRPGCLYPPTGTVYCFKAPHELEVPLPEGAAASASPGTYRVVTSTSSLKIVAQPPKQDGGLKIEMRFLPFEQSGVKRQHSHQSLVGPWLDESGHNGFVECLTSCGRRVLCSGGGDGRLLLWGENGSLVGELSGHHGGVLCVAYTEVPVESLCRDLRRWGSRDHLQVQSPQTECSKVPDDVAHSRQGLLFSGSRDRSIRVWALEQLVCIQTLNAHSSEVLALAADAGRNILISGSANGELFVWQLDLMVVAFELNLNASPTLADHGRFTVGARQSFRPGSGEDQKRGVAFTDLLLVSDSSCLANHDRGSPGTFPRSPNAAGSKWVGGLQLWAGRGDGKLGVWNIGERDMDEEESIEEPYDQARAATREASLSSDCAEASAASASELKGVSSARADAGIIQRCTTGYKGRIETIPIKAQRGICGSRIKGMIITPGASMPSLPPLTTGAGLEPRRRDFLPLLAQFVAYKSISASRCPRHVSGCIGAAKFVAQLFEQALGATVDIVWPRRSAASSEFDGDQGEGQPHPVVFGRLGTNPQHPTIVFYSHYDVVSAGASASSSAPTPSDGSEGSASPITAAASPTALPRTGVLPAGTQHSMRCSIEADACGDSIKRRDNHAKHSEWHGTGWHSNPWRIHCKDGYIYGRGVTDNKGPIICSLLAVKQFIAEWRRKHRVNQTAHDQCSQPNTTTGSASQHHAPAKNDHAIPFNFVWICEGDEENGSVGLADAVAQKASWLHGTHFLICNNSYWADDVTPCLVYGMRGVLDIRVEATAATGDGGYHSGVHGGSVEEPMQRLVHLLGRMYDPTTGRVTIPGFYDAVQAPDYAELQRIKVAAESVETGWIKDAFATGVDSPQELLRKRWLEPSMSLLGINASLKGNCAQAGGAMRIIPSTASAEISLRLVPNQVWGVEPLYVREGGSMPAIPFLADALRRLPSPKGCTQSSEEIAVCQLPFGQASDNAHLPNERLGIRQVEKGVDVLASTLEYLAARLHPEG